MYAGEQYDHDLALYYNRARYLDVGRGRFWSQDTFEGRNEEPASLHKYLYAHGNPVNNIDPSGNSNIELQIRNTVALIVSALSTQVQRLGSAIQNLTTSIARINGAIQRVLSSGRNTFGGQDLTPRGNPCFDCSKIVAELKGVDFTLFRGTLEQAVKANFKGVVNVLEGTAAQRAQHFVVLIEGEIYDLAIYINLIIYGRLPATARPEVLERLKAIDTFAVAEYEAVRQLLVKTVIEGKLQ